MMSKVLKICVRWVVMAVCISMLLSLLGCGKEKPQMLDGPGMEYVSPWTELTVSVTDSQGQQAYSFTVTETDMEALVTGVCRDQEGNQYEEKTGIPIADETVWALRWMNLDQLEDVAEGENPDNGNRTCSIILRDGTVEQKQLSETHTQEIYELLLPYFINNPS